MDDDIELRYVCALYNDKMCFGPIKPCTWAEPGPKGIAYIKQGTLCEEHRVIYWANWDDKKGEFKNV